MAPGLAPEGRSIPGMRGGMKFDSEGLKGGPDLVVIMERGGSGLIAEVREVISNAGGIDCPGPE